jgi:hypothetical protein
MIDAAGVQNFKLEAAALHLNPVMSTCRLAENNYRDAITYAVVFFLCVSDKLKSTLFENLIL